MRICSQCDGSIEIKEKCDYKGYQIAKWMKCSNCNLDVILKLERMEKFKEQVNEFMQYTSCSFSEGNNFQEKKNLEEIFSQHVLRFLMPSFEAIYMDTGEIKNQYDLLLTNSNFNIAVEITRAINANAMQAADIIKNNEKGFPIKSKYNWILNIEPNTKLKHPDIASIASILNDIENHKNNKKMTEFSNQHIQNDIAQKNFLNQLKALGVIHFIATQSKDSEGIIEIPSIHESSTLDPLNIFQVAVEESNKNDNLKKLGLSGANEKHIFIPIVRYKTGAAFYLQCMKPKKQEVFLKEQIKDKLEKTIPDDISVIWLSTFHNFDGHKMGFRLAKIINKKDEYLLEEVSNGIMPYHS